jgi:transcriptional regulator with XRE-family HTH domain
MNSQQVELVKKEFGRIVQLIRSEKGLTLREVGENCGLDNSKVSKIENGMINVTLSTLVSLALGLDVQPSELLKGNFR